MCGRYKLSRRKQIIEEHFDSVSGEEDWIPKYNVAPTQPVPVIRQNPKGTHPRIVTDALGIDSRMGQGFVHRRQHDQREVGNGGHESHEIPSVHRLEFLPFFVVPIEKPGACFISRRCSLR
jgi:hypothetical protein